MNWISVKDKLPPEGEWVLINDEHDEMHVASFSPIYERGYCSGQWRYMICTCCDIMADPTHWMPLPEKP